MGPIVDHIRARLHNSSMTAIIRQHLDILQKGGIRIYAVLLACSKLGDGQERVAPSVRHAPEWCCSRIGW